MYGYIYITTNKVNGKQYIGKHKYNRREKSYLGSGVILRRAIEKYGKENFKQEVIVECETFEILNEMEKYFIEKHDACNNSKFYNVSSGGTGGDVTKGMSKERYEEYCNAFKGKNNPMYGSKREGINAPMYGKTLSNEHKKKISEARKGKKHSDDTKNKISSTFKEKYKNGHHLSEKVISKSIDGEILNEFNSMGEAAKFYNTYVTKVSRMCKNLKFDKSLNVSFEKKNVQS